MILWPAGLALVLVWMIFRDPAIDYRLVVVGALLPDVVDAPFGGTRVLHTVLASVVLLAGVMLATRHRRPLRRRLLAVPIGTFLHLVLDGMWTRTETFWWPFLGRRLEGDLPFLDRPVAVLVAQELAGAVALAWLWREWNLANPQVRGNLLRTGRLPRTTGG
ncbi:MAG TPA: metal-dependent hydrolase [Acidimicrobiales bacterium]